MNITTWAPGFIRPWSKSSPEAACAAGPWLWSLLDVGELYQRRSEIVTLCSPPHHQDWGRAGTAGNRLARDDKEPGPSWGKQLPGERPRETAETWHTSPNPNRHVRRKGAAAFSGSEEQTPRSISAYAQSACLFSSKMGSIN
jgi:hypothetical protein